MEDDVIAEFKHALFWGDGSENPGAPGFEHLDPADPEHFCRQVTLYIGSVGLPATDSFDVTVCSPSWFAERIAEGEWDVFLGYSFGFDAILARSKIWFMRRWDKAMFDQAVTRLCTFASPGPDWSTVANRISQFLQWEWQFDPNAGQF